MYDDIVMITVIVVMVTVNQITELTDLTEENLPTLTTLDCHGNALTNAKNINISTLRKLYLVSILPVVDATMHTVGNVSCIYREYMWPSL